MWLLAFWFLAALGVVCRYWVVRYLFRREGRPPYIMGSPTGIYQVTAHGWGLPGVTVVAVISYTEDQTLPYSAPVAPIRRGCQPALSWRGDPCSSTNTRRGYKPVS